MFSAVNVLFIKWSGRIADSNATLSKSVALDNATYRRPLANGETHIFFKLRVENWRQYQCLMLHRRQY